MKKLTESWRKKIKEEIILDADICIKLGRSKKRQYLYNVLPMLSDKIYIHSYTRSEVRIPDSSVKQLNLLIKEEKVKEVSKDDLTERQKALFDNASQHLETILVNPSNPNKNKGETYALAYAQAKGIPIFLTDERKLQRIIDKEINRGDEYIHCVGIEDIIQMARRQKIEISRRDCKRIWIAAEKDKKIFDNKIWPIDSN